MATQTTQAPRHVGKNVRNFVFSVIASAFPRLAPLGRDHFVGTTESTEYWIGSLRGMFNIEHMDAETLASNAREADAKRSIPAHLTFRMANELKQKLGQFERTLEDAYVADEVSRSARQPPKPNAEPTVPTPGTLGADAKGAGTLARLADELGRAAPPAAAPQLAQ